MTVTIPVSSGDTVRQTVMAIPNVPLTLTFDFTATLQAAETLTSAQVSVSNSFMVAGSPTRSGATVSVALTNTFTAPGQTCDVALAVVGSAGSQDGRGVTFVSYDVVP